MAYRTGVTVTESTSHVGDGPFAQKITIPAGTRVRSVTDGMGFEHWTVVSKELLIRLSGNTHDPIYRYSFVPADCVKVDD